MEKTKQRARMLVYWPKMNGDIESLIINCPTCQKHSRNNQKEPLMNSQIPLVPWQQVASDIFDWNEAKYLITVDLPQPLLWSRPVEKRDIQRSHQLTKSTFCSTWDPPHHHLRQRNTILICRVWTVHQRMGHKAQDLQPYLPAVQWTGRKGCPHLQGHLHQGKWRRRWPVSWSTGIQKYTRRQLRCPCTTANEPPITLHLTLHRKAPAEAGGSN